MVRAVLNKENKSLHNMFPTVILEEEVGKLKDYYEIRFISVFDHGLSEEEAATEIVFFHEKFQNKKEMTKYYTYEQLFINFYNNLYDATKVTARLFSYTARHCYVTFDSKEEYLSHVLLSIREQLFLEIMLPEYNAVISGCHDLTHMLMVRKMDHVGLEKVTRIVQENKLYMLP